jgi:hypothetical protein
MGDFSRPPEQPQRPAPSPTGLAPTATRPDDRSSNFYDDLQQRVIRGADANYSARMKHDAEAQATFDDARRRAHADGALDEMAGPAAPARFQGTDPATWMPRPGSSPTLQNATRTAPRTLGTRAASLVGSVAARVFGRARGR